MSESTTPDVSTPDVSTPDLFPDSYDNIPIPSPPETPIRWPAELQRMADVVEQAVAEAPSTDPRRLAEAVVMAIANDLGGRQVYLPRGKSLQCALRDRAIYRQFNGRNHRQLADQHGIAVPHVYRIIAQQRRLHR